MDDLNYRAMWTRLTDGLEIKEGKGNIPPELVDRLDVVYVLGNGNDRPYALHGVDIGLSKQDIDGVTIEVRKIAMRNRSAVKVIVSDGGNLSAESEKTEVVKKARGKDNILNRLLIFGAMIDEPFEDNAVTPLFCLDEKPKGESIPHLERTRYDGGYFPSEGYNCLIKIENSALATIDIHPDGTGSIYLGSAIEPPSADAILFEEPIPFDLEKRLILARSPNGTVDLDALHRLRLTESDNEFEYAVVYANVKQLTADKTWAIRGRKGIQWKENLHIKIFTGIR